MKIAWSSNAHLQPTGYATICKNVVPYIKKHSHHELIEVAISGLNRVMPFDWDGVKVYGATGMGGKLGIGDWPGIQAIEKPDVWMLNFDAWATGPAIVQTGIKYVIYPPIDHDPLSPLWLPALRNAVEIIPYCKFGERVMRQGLGITAPIVDPIPHGVDTTAFHPMDADREKVFGRETPGFVAGIFKNNQGTRSRYDVQIAGFRRFMERVGDDRARLYIHAAKTGQQGFDLGSLVSSNGLEGFVYLVGPARYRQGLSVEEMAESYNACDVILNAVAGEGWGLPITEAFACGKPVIGTAFSAMPELIAGMEGTIRKRSLAQAEVVEGARGWLVPTLGTEYTLGKKSTRCTIDAGDVGAALVKAYQSPDKRAAMGENAREFAQQFSWDKVGKMWVDYFDRLEETITPKQYTWKPIEEKLPENKTAVVVFSFNRPDYLVKTLKALSENTQVDKCDFYFYQDGYMNDPAHPYATPEVVATNKEKVEQCMGILAGFPFAHKRIIAKTRNVCIGRQLQEAKALLFDHTHIEDDPHGAVNGIPNYEHVIFFDDDHVVSRDYVDVLLKLHAQYPGAIVGAQATERRNIPPNATLDQVGVTTKQYGDAKAVPGRWRWLGYLMPKAVHEATVDEMNEYVRFIGPNYRDIPHNAVRAKYGVVISGFDGIMDKLCDDKGIERIATVIPRSRYIGESGLFGSPELFQRMGFPRYSRFEFDDEPDTFRITGAAKKGLDKYAGRSFSQNGEDGILRHIFSEIGFESRKFLEFGFAVPECNTWRLMKEEGFTGQYMDISAKTCAKFLAYAEKTNIEGVTAVNVRVTAENIERYTAVLPKELDLLSIDIDGNDYWVWKAIKRLSPRVVVIEYNAAIEAGLSKTIPYDPKFEWHGGAYYGASLEALAALGKEKGYRLIGCDPMGVNAFFLRDDVEGSSDETLTPGEAYRPNPKTTPRDEEWATVKDKEWTDV